MPPVVPNHKREPTKSKPQHKKVRPKPITASPAPREPLRAKGLMLEQEILTCIYHFKLTNAYAPTLEEIGASVGRVKSVVNMHIVNLIARGMLTRKAGMSRTIALTDEGKREALRAGAQVGAFEPVVVLTPRHVDALSKVLRLAREYQREIDLDARASGFEPKEFEVVDQLIKLGQVGHL